MQYLGAFLIGFLFIGCIYHPEYVAIAGIFGAAVSAAILPILIVIWVIQQIIKGVGA